jgi:RNA polymerase sigma-B factor
VARTSSDTTQIARKRLIESHLPLVRSLARRYAGRGETLEDLVQVGSIGLIKASDRFDEGRGVAFATFAAPAIEGEIRRHLRDRSSVVRIPRELQRTSGELREQHGQLSAALGHSPSVGEIAAALDTDEQHVQRALTAEQARDTVPLSPEGDTVELPVDSDQESGSEDRLSLAPGMRALDERERAIVFLRFHLDMTELQIARKLGISQAHVSRLLTGALSQLRSDLADSNRGTGERDITAGKAEPAAFAGRPTPDKAPRDKGSRTNVRRRAAKIRRVRASHHNRTLARYLELPYSVAVKSEREGEQTCWSATVEELPGCTVRAETPDEAVELLRPAMEDWLQAALEENRKIPLPGGESGGSESAGDESAGDESAGGESAGRESAGSESAVGEGPKRRSSSSHSGRFLVRMPGTLHTQLARAAEREHLSLNRFVTKVLASSVSPKQAASSRAATQPAEETIEPGRGSRRKPSRTLRLALATNLAVVVFAGLAAIVLLVLALHNGF